MFEGDSADMCAGKFPLTSMGGRAEGLVCADPGARTPIGASGNLTKLLSKDGVWGQWWNSDWNKPLPCIQKICQISHRISYLRISSNSVYGRKQNKLFWASFGLIDLDNFEFKCIKEFTWFWELIMFWSFSVINMIVLLNLLIAMMNHSYQLISVSSVRCSSLVPSSQLTLL